MEKLTKGLLKLLIVDFLEEKFFFREMSCYGEILEGALYFATNYGDSGELFLDHLNFHKNNQRVEDLNLLEDAFGATNQGRSIKNIDS